MKKFLLFTGFIAVFTISVQAQCVQLLHDGFESGTFTSPWTIGVGSYALTFPNSGAPVGTYNLMMSSSGSGNFYEGVHSVFTPGQPTYMSWWMRTDVTNAANGYVVIGDANMPTDNGVIFCYFNASSQLRFYGSTGFNHPITANTWYHVEARNVNWTARTSDIYVNNVLILTSWPFRSGTATSIDRVHMFSLNPSNPEYDEFVIGNPAVTGSAVSTGTTCFGGNDGSATVTAGGGTGAYTYSWAPTGGTAATATNLLAGTYSCTITDAIGCTNVTTVTVTEPTAISASTTQIDVLCFGGNTGEATLSVSGGSPGYTYLWSTGWTGATASALTAGVYTYTVTDVAGCAMTQSLSITEPPQLVSSAANNGDVCANSAATLVGTATGGTSSYTYTWMPGNLSGSTVNDIPTGPTTYTLMVTDANGCTSSSTTTVLVNTPPTVDLGPDTTVCLGMFLDAQNPGSTYLWNDNSTQQMLGVTASGTYYVTVTDINGCSASDTVNVTVDAQPNGGIISSSGGVDVCPGDSVVFSSTGAAGTIDWWVMLVSAPFWQNFGSGNPFASSPSVADTGTYQFMAIASNGVCPADTSNIITVIVHVPPVVNLADTVVCGGVVLDAGNAGPSTTYLWSDMSVQSDLTVMQSGSYWVIVTDQFGCTGTDSADVTVNAYPAGVAGSASSFTPCLDDANVILTGTPAGGVWTGPGVTGNTFDPSIGLGTNTPTYTYTDTTNGCAASATITINVNACVGVDEVVKDQELNVYPNPNNGLFYVAANMDITTLIIEVVNLEGKVVYSSKTSNVQAGSVQQLDLSTQKSGVYLLRINADQQQSTQRIIITK